MDRSGFGCPFRRRTLTRKPELPARMVDQGLEEPQRDAGLVPSLSVER